MDCLTLSSNPLYDTVIDLHPEAYAMKWSLWQAGITLEAAFYYFFLIYAYLKIWILSLLT